MRRSLFRLLTVVAVAGLFAPGCQVFESTGALRVVSINGGNTLRSDLSDFYVYFDKEDSEYVTLYQVAPDSVQVEMQYIEIGPGLPTYTPYAALLKEASVKFTSVLPYDPDDLPTYQTVKIPLTQSVQADPDGKKTTMFYMTPIQALWKEAVFGEDGFIIDDDPYASNFVDLAKVDITFSGYDSVHNSAVKAVGTFMVEFGNFYDDESRFGK